MKRSTRFLPTMLACAAFALGAGTAMAEPSGTLTASSSYDVISLNPTGSTGADLGTALTSKALFDTLLTRAGDTFSPSLATSWSVSDDGKSYTFQLRDDAAFHDGSPVTAADVVASVQTFAETPGPLAALWKPVTAEANGDHEVVLHLDVPKGSLLSNLTALEIMPAAAAGNEDFWNSPVGSGPFVFESFSPGQELRLTANADYWGGAPNIANLVFRVIPEISSRVAAIETGEIDVTWNIPDDLLPSLRNNADLTVETVTSLSSYVLWFNPSDGPLADTRVRQACGTRWTSKSWCPSCTRSAARWPTPRCHRKCSVTPRSRRTRTIRRRRRNCWPKPVSRMALSCRCSSRAPSSLPSSTP